MRFCSGSAPECRGGTCLRVSISGNGVCAASALVRGRHVAQDLRGRAGDADTEGRMDWSLLSRSVRGGIRSARALVHVQPVPTDTQTLPAGNSSNRIDPTGLFDLGATAASVAVGAAATVR